MLFEAHSINAEHKDLIHDVAYDFYGQRMATCSSDQFVKVWDQDEQENWVLTATWKAHSGSVWKVTWAHPEFGQVLATCSFDRTGAIWEEIVGEGTTPGERGQRHWVRRTNLVDSRTSVTDVKFGPKSLGLVLATCSADGVIRIYEAPDVMNLSQWTLQHEVSCKLTCSCLTWSHSFSRLHPAMIAVGSDDSNPGTGSKVLLLEYSENSRRWTKTDSVPSVCDPVHDIAFAPNLGRSYHLLAVATKDVRILTLKPRQEGASVQGNASRFDVQVAAQFDDHICTVWRVCWNVTGTILASSGDDGCVRLWKCNHMNNWKCVSVLKGDGTQAQASELPPPPPTPGTIAAPQPLHNARSSKWQPTVIKGRFTKTTLLGTEPAVPSHKATKKCHKFALKEVLGAVGLLKSRSGASRRDIYFVLDHLHGKVQRPVINYALKAAVKTGLLNCVNNHYKLRRRKGVVAQTRGDRTVRTARSRASSRSVAVRSRSARSRARRSRQGSLSEADYSGTDYNVPVRNYECRPKKKRSSSVGVYRFREVSSVESCECARCVDYCDTDVSSVYSDYSQYSSDPKQRKKPKKAKKYPMPKRIKVEKKTSGECEMDVDEDKSTKSYTRGKKGKGTVQKKGRSTKRLEANTTEADTASLAPQEPLAGGSADEQNHKYNLRSRVNQQGSGSQTHKKRGRSALNTEDDLEQAAEFSAPSSNTNN